MSVMPLFGALLIDPCTLIGYKSDLIEFVQLQLPLLSGAVQIIVQHPNRPVCPMLKLHM